MVTIIDRYSGDGPGTIEKPGVIGYDARGRGAQTNQSGRFERFSSNRVDDGWRGLEDLPVVKTSVIEETPRRAITSNKSPDLAFDRSINPYRGCEHGCSYCFARPTHAFMGLSPGLDFETKLFAKTNVAACLRQELGNPKYKPKTIALGTNTDPYQPIERERRLTRDILEVLSEHNHPVAIVTKSIMVTRDIDILSDMAQRGLAKVAISITTLDRALARAMEPRASTPALRLRAIEALSQAGIPTTVMMAPVIPALNDAEIEGLLKHAAQAGAQEAAYVLLRLPLEVRDIFSNWLRQHYPDRADHVLSLIRSMRGGKDYDASWGQRMRGTGPYAWSIGRRFELACKRLKLNQNRVALTNSLFHRPAKLDAQLSLFASTGLSLD